MKILAVGAHLDDIELAAGGTLAKACEAGHIVKVLIMSKSGYTNKDGNKVYTNDCLVDNCEFAESKATAEQNQKNDNKSGNDDFMNIPDGVEDGLPFN